MKNDNEVVEMFEEKVEEAKLLEKNMDKLLIDFEDIFDKFEEEHVKHFVLELIGQVVYIVDRVKLLKTGQCVRPYQNRTESKWISKSMDYSFEKSVRERTKFDSSIKLSECSYEGIRFNRLDRNAHQKLMLDNARCDLDAMIGKFRTGVENALWLLHNRSDILIQTQLDVAIKMRDHVRIVGKSKLVLVDSSAIKHNTGKDIFASSECLRDDINSTRIRPMDGCDHYAWLTTRSVQEETQEQEVAAFVEKRNRDYVSQKEGASLNKLLKIGSRVPKKNKPRSFPDLNPSTPSDEGFQTTCDTDNFSGSHSAKSNSSNRDHAADDSIRFVTNSSTPMIVTTEKKVRISEVANLNLDAYDDSASDTSEQIKSRRKNQKRAREAKEEEDTQKQFGGFYVRDGEGEESEVEREESSVDGEGTDGSDDIAEEEHSDTFASERSSSSKTSAFLSESHGQEEDEEEDFKYLDRYKAVKAGAKTLGVDSHHHKLESSVVLTEQRKSSSSKAKRVESSGVIKTENPHGLEEVKFKPVSFRKKSRGEYATNYVEEIEVHVHNKLYSVKRTMHEGSSDTFVVGSQVEDVKDTDRQLNSDFISFLVAHTVTIVGAEIALERCIIDYVLKKQELNKLNYMEQQDISNWKNIFINIENLIMVKIDRENRDKKDLLDGALETSINLIEEDFRRERNVLGASETSLSGQEQGDRIHASRTVADKKRSDLQATNVQLKALLDATLKTTNQKINSAIHYIALKVCVYWANINNCLDIIEPALVNKYSLKFLRQDRLNQQLLSATTTGRLLIDADKCEDQLVTSEDTVCSLAEEESELRKIVRNDHAQELLNVIYAVKAQPQDIAALGEILWSKTPRTKLSTAVAVKKEGVEKKKKGKKGSVDAVVIDITHDTSPPLSVVLSDAQQTLVKSINTSVDVSPAAADSGWNQTTLSVDKDGRLGFLSNSESRTSSLLPSRPTPVVSTDFPALPVDDSINSVDNIKHLKNVLASFDHIAKSLFIGLFGQNEILCLEIEVKEKRDFYKSRENENLYDLLNCLFYIKVNGFDGSVIMGDGYCFYRAVYQIYLHQAGGYVSASEEMKISDRECNTKNMTDESEIFVGFVGTLKAQVKVEAAVPDSIAAEFELFKFNSDCDLLSTLLKKRPGVAVDTKMWGSQSVVPLLDFNVTSLEALSDKPSSVVEKMLVVDTADNGKSTRWVRFQSSSIPTPRSKVSKAKSSLSFKDLDQVVSFPLNPLLYSSGHFTTGATAFSSASVDANVTLSEDFHNLKKLLFCQAFKRVEILKSMFPDIVQNLDDLMSFLSVKQVTAETNVVSTLVVVDSQSFVERLNREFPESIRVKSVVVDLSREEESHDSIDVAMLKDMVKFNKLKVELLAMHNKVLRDVLLSSNV